MIEALVAKRYGDAYLAACRRSIGAEPAIEELLEFRGGLVRTNPEFLKFLESVEIPYSEKYRLIDRIITDDYSAELRSLLKLLVERQRIDRLRDIIEYIRVTYAHPGEVEAVIKTSFLLDVGQLREIKE
ncbi:MAG: F0F1 ATP synthase subunit delta, partial [Candidatus Omnitrophica bacterium]|nr:F0F1 ATP synthase subunit delta [Candidatus Omnitrophota bacterium]